MISHIHIKNFKSLKDVSIEMSNLNLLTGINGVGKSSLIQVLLLLHQSYNSYTNGINRLNLNGIWTNLGTQSDILCKSADEDKIEIELQDNERLEKYVFDYSPSNKDKTYIDTSLSIIAPKEYTYSLYNSSKFRYLFAERISPENDYKASQGEVEYKNLGKKGEFTVEYINKYGQTFCKLFTCNIALDEEGKALPLLNQIDAWMDFISPNIKVKTNFDSALNSYKLSYEYSDGLISNNYKPINIGFGITYILPIVTAILISESGDLLILENPEAHLHPQGQSKLGELMAIAAEAGVQIIVETHSDHILNGVRVAVNKFHKGNKGISKDKVKILYFAENKTELIAEPYTIPINKEGTLSLKELRKNNISGFFDQINKDINILLGIND
ncbi:MAG: AAA family ATPase [Bacteroidia bacterium]